MASVDERSMAEVKARSRSRLDEHMRQTRSSTASLPPVVELQPRGTGPDDHRRRGWAVTAAVASVACAGLVALGMYAVQDAGPNEIDTAQSGAPTSTATEPSETTAAPPSPTDGAWMSVAFVPPGYASGGPAERTFDLGVETVRQSFVRPAPATGEIDGEIFVARVESVDASSEAARLSSDHGGRSAAIQSQDGFVFTGPGNNAVAVWATTDHIFTVSATGLTESDVLAVAESVTVG